MKRLYIIFSLILVLAVLALPAIARADDNGASAPTGWTWDESSAPASVNGWTWDEA